MNRLFTAQQETVVTIDKEFRYLAAMPGVAVRSATVTAEQIAMFIETAFWASLRSNEGRAVRFSATIAAPGDFPGAVVFAEAVRYDEEQVAKIAPALPPGGWLGVSTDPFTIWGFGQGRPWPAFRTINVDVSEPGILRLGLGPYHPYAVLDGRLDTIIAETPITLTIELQRALRKPEPAAECERHADWYECIALGDLVRLVLAEGHGVLYSLCLTRPAPGRNP